MLADAAVVVRGADVTVVYDFVVQQGECMTESVEVYLSSVLLTSGTGMDGDAGEGITIEDWYEFEDFIGGFQPQTHLDTEGGL